MAAEFIDTEKANLSQHFLSSQISEACADLLLPLLKSSNSLKGTIVIGCSFGDFHGLGKKIVKAYLKSSLYNVIDLGLSVKPETFIVEAVKNRASIILISSMKIHTARSEQGSLGVRKILADKNLGHIKIIVGGAPYRFDKHLYTAVHADAFAKTALESVKTIQILMNEVKI